jgi:hypothetical protein
VWKKRQERTVVAHFLIVANPFYLAGETYKEFKRPASCILLSSPLHFSSPPPFRSQRLKPRHSETTADAEKIRKCLCMSRESTRLRDQLRKS